LTDTNRFYIDKRVLEQIENGKDYAYAVFEARNTEVVLGRSAKAEEDLYLEACKQDEVMIHRRAGGGGSVVLCSGVVVISIAGKTALAYHLKEHMNAVNLIVIKTLHGFGVRNLWIKGVSDVTIGDKKILGSSLHRKKDLVLYQGALLVHPQLDLIARYLRHPKKEPDYRMGRRHTDFITSLYREGYRIDITAIIDALQRELTVYRPWPLEKENAGRRHFQQKPLKKPRR
jgi:lipoate-protein ligase A